MLGAFAHGQGPPQAFSNPSDPLQQHYAAASAFLRRGDPQHAGGEYKAFLSEALHRAANAEAQISELSKASDFFAQAMEFANHDSSLFDDFASLRFDQGRLAEAETLLNSALQLNAGDVRAHFLLGRVLFNQEKYVIAKPHFEIALSKGEPREVWFLLGVTDLKLQQLAAARDLFVKILIMLRDKASTHFRLGLAYYTGDYPDEAVIEFKKAIARDPKALDQHYYLGLAYLGHNPEAGFGKAEPEFRAELALSPADFRSHYMLGYIAFKQARTQEAEGELAQALSLKPADIATLLLTAEFDSGTHRDSDAEPLLRKAIALAGDSPLNYEIVRAHYMLGRILQRSGRTDEAAKELALSEELRLKFRAASGNTPSDRTPGPRPDRPSADNPKTVSAEERLKAESFIRQLSPAVAEAFNNLGAIAANQQECPACVFYFQRAGEWDPSLEGLDRNLGRAAFLCKQYDQAVPPLSRYLEQHSDDVTVRSALGLSLFRLGNYQKVLQVLDPIRATIQSNAELLNAYTTALANVQKPNVQQQ